ncbi:hypothetical protein QBC36DRAFT_389326 [Triangularia setosa]|uniref:NACHT domain-containing protein n=1 Tax=Triangularia setosa TaxID=2587417 RepID=A0AAN7A3G3_9PEZI|nr:hypothetical protein QBC36DRAFT_389326 [Podospora setosa]
MESLTALAVAGNILQFIEFVGKLFINTNRIFSIEGASTNTAHLDQICRQLTAFSTRLHNGHSPLTLPNDLVESAIFCRKDCNRLLEITAKLKAKASKSKTSRCWSSFKLALAEVCQTSEIEALRLRISEHRSQMTAQLCIMSRFWEKFNDIRHKELLNTLQPLEILVQTLKNPSDPEVEGLDRLCLGLSTLSLDTRQYVAEAKVLKSLHYPEMPLRYDIISDAHKVTLNWAFRSQSDEGTSMRFGALNNWMTGTDGLFWISGKPGSGKSTLVKFLVDNPSTGNLLRKWSCGQQITMAAHYFTIHGTPIQRSLEGLLRSLVYSILRQEPKLISELLPERIQNQDQDTPWTLQELQLVVQRASEQQSRMRICFFIDGLDEYSGDHLEICETLLQLSRSPSVKLCVSSRPWNVFEDALGNKPHLKLYMQDLTRHDIHQYIVAVLHAHPRWSILADEAGSDKADALVGDIVSRASGVFLWVTLVTRLLREGLTNDDSIRDLKRRVDSFPSDLGPFFRLILSTVDPFYQDRMARSLLFALHAQEPLHIQMYMFHDREYDDEDYALAEPKRIVATTEDAEWRRTSQAARVFRRINGWCKGLLERNHDRIEFLHRTQTLKEKANNNNTNFSYTKRPEEGMPEVENPLVILGPFVNKVEKMLVYARRLEAMGGSSVFSAASLLDNMDSSIDRLPSEQHDGKTITMARMIYRYQILKAGLKEYLVTKLPNTSYFDRLSFSRLTDQSPLSVILEEPPTKDFFQWAAKAIMDSGHSPNDIVHPCDRTPWERFLMVTTSIFFRNDELPAFITALENDAFLILLGYGADPNGLVLIHAEKAQWDIPVWFKFLLYAAYLPSLSKHTTAYEATLDVMLKGAEPEVLFQSLQRPRRRTIPRFITDLTSGRTVLQTFAKSLSRLTPVERGKFAGARDWLVKMLPGDIKDEAFSLLDSLDLDSAGIGDLRREHGKAIATGCKRDLKVAGFVDDSFGDWKKSKRL